MPPKYFLAVCSVVKNEAPYFAEWINFHRLMGVEHFFIYHNAKVDEDQATREVILHEKARHEDVTYIVWPGVAQQCTCFQHCLTVNGDSYEWIAFIDTDEFLWSPKYPDFPETVQRVYEDRPRATDVAAIAVHWMLFGSSGQTEKQDGLVIERFIRRSRSVNSHVKSICRPRNIKSAGPNPHAFLPKTGFSIVDERGVELPDDYANSTTGSADILRINHFHTKSFSEFLSRKSGAPDCNSGVISSPEWIEERFRAHDVNDVEDTLLRDLYADKVKEMLL